MAFSFRVSLNFISSRNSDFDAAISLEEPEAHEAKAPPGLFLRVCLKPPHHLPRGRLYFGGRTDVLRESKFDFRIIQRESKAGSNNGFESASKTLGHVRGVGLGDKKGFEWLETAGSHQARLWRKHS
jgi:hypothetical protein